MKALCLVIALNFFAVLLSSRESLIPTTIRQVSRNSVGVFPLLLCSGGFPCYTIGIVSPHLCRVTISDAFSSKFRNEFHSQIWDPGISNGGSIDRHMKFRSTSIDYPCSLFYSPVVPFLFLTNLQAWKQFGDNTLPLAVVLGFGIQGRILSYDDDAVCKYRAFAISILVSAFHNQRTNVYGIRSRQWVIKSPSIFWNRFSRCNVTFLFWSLIEWAINADADRILLQKHKSLKNTNGLGLRGAFLSLRIQRNGGDVFPVFRSYYFGSMDTEFMVTNEQHILSDYLPESSNILVSMKRQDPGSFPTTLISHFLSKVMSKAFWSLSYKLLANNKYVEGGHNRLFHLLAWQTSERIAGLLSTLSSKLFQFPIFAYTGCNVLVLYFVNSF